MEVLLAQPRGFCAGVVRAIDVVEHALQRFGPPVHVFHEIVHNSHVVDDLRSRGAIFVDDIDAVPPGSVTIFSAHGVADAVVARARQRRLRVIDATCPLVAKVHLKAQRYARDGRSVIIIGHRGHDEVEGTLGAVEGDTHVVSDIGDVDRLPLSDAARTAYVTQTTLSVDDTRAVIAALQARFPTIAGPQVSDICYATQNRQNAVRALAREVDLVLVVGSRNSSNSCRLQEVARLCGVSAHLIEHVGEVDTGWLAGVERVGITAGASTPECLVREVCDRLLAWGATSVRTLPGPHETAHFRSPAMPPVEAVTPDAALA